MKCSEFRQEITYWLNNGSFRDEDGQFAVHLRECELCRAYYSDVLLTRALNEEPIPRPDSQFAERVLDRAVSCGRRRRKGRIFRGLSAAAAVLMVFFAGYLVHFTTQHSPVGEQRHMEMAMSGGDGDSIQVLIETERARQDATFTVALEGEVALKNLPDRRRVQWRTDLVRGRNLLELPVVLRGDSGGTIRVGYQYDSERQEVSVRVKPSDATRQNDGREI